MLFRSLIRFDGIVPKQFMDSFFKVAPIFTLIGLISFYIFGLYHRLWQYASIGELLVVVYGVTLAITINITFVYFLIEGGSLPLPRSVFLLDWLLMQFFIGGSRLAWRLFRDHSLNTI